MSSDFSDFLGQDFMKQMLPLICIIGLLLIVTIVAIVYMRRRKAMQALAQTISPSFVTDADYSSSSHDMPHLNLLVHTPNLPPAPSPASIAVPPVAAASAPIRSARKGT